MDISKLKKILVVANVLGAIMIIIIILV